MIAANDNIEDPRMYDIIGLLLKMGEHPDEAKDYARKICRRNFVTNFVDNYIWFLRFELGMKAYEVEENRSKIKIV